MKNLFLLLRMRIFVDEFTFIYSLILNNIFFLIAVHNFIFFIPISFIQLAEQQEDKENLKINLNQPQTIEINQINERK